jgi:hypothetical protein
MRGLLMLICFFISIAAIAQQRDSMYVSKGKLIIRDATTENGKAYIEVDGKIFTGKLSGIKSDDINDFSVLKISDAMALYGTKGMNGAYLITTKAGRIAAMQPSTNKPLDNINSNNGAFTGNQTMVSDSAMYLIDGKLSTKKEVNNLHPEDILSIDVLKKDTVADPSLNQIKGDIIAVLTKISAIKSYQNKFGQFSKDYKDFLKGNNNNDNMIVYLNKETGDIYSSTNKDGIKALYRLSADSIKKVDFNKGHEVMSGNYPPTVIITTEK